MTKEQLERIEEINAELEILPKETLTFKTIKGKKQPYLQWTEDGKTKSKYLKLKEREYVFSLINKKEELKAEKKRLLSYGKRISEILRKNPTLSQSPPVGEQSFYQLMRNKGIYIDKTRFISQWWNRSTSTTLITRPRRFGKTLTLSMVECFFSTNYYFETEELPTKDLFVNMDVWKDKKMQQLQGTIPTIFFSFAAVKSRSFKDASYTICFNLRQLFSWNHYLVEDDTLNEEQKKMYWDTYHALRENDIHIAQSAINTLCELKSKFHQRNVLVLLDEYDTPLIEAYQSPDDWNKMIAFMRTFFNLTLKSNPCLEKALLTGITRIAKESLFSDLNHIEISTVTSDLYSDIFGFTRDELEELLICQNNNEMEQVKAWYDGYTFGQSHEIYNPWSILNYLSQKQFRPYWMNTASHGLLDKLFLKGGLRVKDEIEILMSGGCLHKNIDENIDFLNLETTPDSLWSLLLSTGYLRAENISFGDTMECDLFLVNQESKCMLHSIIRGWFSRSYDYPSFCKYLIEGDLEAMNYYLNEVCGTMISFFDTASPSRSRAPENFYHGLVLGLIVHLKNQYSITSNRESGFGRYDIMMKPLNEELPAIIIEFKLFDQKREQTLEDTANRALEQIKSKNYKEILLSEGIDESRIQSYGFGFRGKEVVILADESC